MPGCSTATSLAAADDAGTEKADMDIYNGWFDLKPGESDTALADAIAGYMGYLQDNGLIEGWRLSRRKLGLGPAQLPEFHLMMEVRDLAQLEQAFAHVASRAEPVETAHHAVNSRVRQAMFALYRDFPDAVRRRGEEKF